MRMLKFIKNRILNCNKIINSFIFNIFYIFYLSVKNYKNSKLKFKRIDEFIQYKESDTLVILGAGASINELSKDDISILNKYDIAGLSYSCVVPMPQTFYFYETPSCHDKNLLDEHVKKLFPEVLKTGEEKATRCNIWKNSESSCALDFLEIENFIAINVCHILANDTEVIKEIFRFFDKFKLSKFVLLQKSGSISAIINFAILLKYKKVIFIGVDLSNSKYFFDDNDNYKKYDFNNPFLLSDEERDKTVHLTNDKSKGQPISNVIKALAEEYKDVEFSTSSKSSLLSTFLPIWHDDSKTTN